MTEPTRRESDKYASLDIDQMILQEDDQKQRAFLIVLHAINKSLIANTETIRDVSDKLEAHLQNFEKHTQEEDALRNRGIGMWKVAAWVIGIAQLVGLGIWQQAREELRDIHTSMSKTQAQISQLESRVLFVETVLK
jgi:hypothetical protein